MFSYVPAPLPLFTRFCFQRFFKCLYINSVNQEMPARIYIFALFMFRLRDAVVVSGNTFCHDVFSLNFLLK